MEVAQKTGQAMHIAVRDMPMFNLAAYAHHHATIAVRDERVLVRTEVVRAVLQRNKMTLFECRCASLPRTSFPSGVFPVSTRPRALRAGNFCAGVHAAKLRVLAVGAHSTDLGPRHACRRPALSESIGRAALHAQHMYRRHASAVPFELQMLEMLLDQTVSYLEHKSAQVRARACHNACMCVHQRSPPATGTTCSSAIAVM